MGDGRQILNIMKNIHLTRTPGGQASPTQRRPFGCIDTGGQLSQTILYVSSTWLYSSYKQYINIILDF